MRAFHFLSTNHALDVLKNQRVKVSRFDDLNDPFELYAAELSDKRHRAAFRRFKKEMAQRFGLLCFSRSWESPLLWSHYGDRHRGVALEFEIEDDRVNEVSYQPNRLLLDIEKKLSVGRLDQTDVDRILRTKFKQWEYEDEVRVFVDLNDPPDENGLHFCALGDGMSLVGLVQGPLCELKEREIASALPKGRSVILTKARLAFRRFAVVPNQAVPQRSIRGVA